MEIDIAALGWQGSEWEGFYPDDMPADWRLDYYANEFLAVIVPYREWSQTDDETVLGWLEQVSEDFRFYWELKEGDEAAMARLKTLLQDEGFARHWGGVVTLSGPAMLSQSPFSSETFAQLPLQQNMGLRPLRGEMEQAMAQGGSRLLVMVAAGAAETLRPARDLALLLGGG